MIWAFIALYAYSGLIMAETGILHKRGKPLTTDDKIGYIGIFLFWSVFLPYYILKQRSSK